MLRELKGIRQDILYMQQGNAPSLRLQRFYCLFSEMKVWDHISAAQGIQKLSSESWKVYWNGLIERLFESAERASADHFLQTHIITWVHGTKSSILPMLFKERALVPMGELLKRGAPPCGAIAGSENALNRNALSGEMMTLNWDELRKNRF